MFVTINHTPVQEEFQAWIKDGIFMHDNEIVPYNVNYKILKFGDVDKEEPAAQEILNELNEFGIQVIETI
jgi:hypothetical protein